MATIKKQTEDKQLTCQPALPNEETVAVGNMKVNARGDKIDANGNVVKTKLNKSPSIHFQIIPKAAVKTVSIKDAVDVLATKTMEQAPVAEKAQGNKKASKVQSKAKQPK